MSAILFPPRYFAPACYYAAMLAAARTGASVIYDTFARYDKRVKAVHRMEIADTHGRLQLTVPVSKGDFEPGSRPLWRDRCVSAHGHWWEIHRTALESAYGRTPFFEFYIDRLLPMISSQSTGRSIVDLDLDLDHAVRQMLHLDASVITPSSAADPLRTSAIPFSHLAIAPCRPYWQVRIDRMGFINNLSVLDMLFNLGPESMLLLSEMADSIDTTIELTAPSRALYPEK